MRLLRLHSSPSNPCPILAIAIVPIPVSTTQSYGCSIMVIHRSRSHLTKIRINTRSYQSSQILNPCPGSLGKILLTLIPTGNRVSSSIRTFSIAVPVPAKSSDGFAMGELGSPQWEDGTIRFGSISMCSDFSRSKIVKQFCKHI